MTTFVMNVREFADDTCDETRQADVVASVTEREDAEIEVRLPTADGKGSVYLRFNLADLVDVVMKAT